MPSFDSFSNAEKQQIQKVEEKQMSQLFACAP